MRVIHVMESTIGGTRRHLLDVACGQSRAGLEVKVVAAAERQKDVRDDFERMRNAGCEVEELPMVRSIDPRMDARHARALQSEFRAWRPDVVHTHSSKAGALGRWASLRSGVGRRVHTPHTFAFLFDAMFGGVKRRIFRGVEVALAKRTDRVVAVSESEADTIRKSGVVAPKRLSVVPNGVDVAPWMEARAYDRASLGLAQGAGPVGAVVGLLNAAKGQDVAIRALAGAAEGALLVVGHGDDEPELRALAQELDVAERVHFLGWRTDVPRILASVDYLLLPSRWEGMPYIVLEAFASGLPVVATAVDGVRELVSDGSNGLVVPIEDEGAMAQAMNQIAGLSPEQRAAWGEHGQSQVSARYSTDAMVRGLIGVYEEVLG